MQRPARSGIHIGGVGRATVAARTAARSGNGRLKPGAELAFATVKLHTVIIQALITTTAPCLPLGARTPLDQQNTARRLACRPLRRAEELLTKLCRQRTRRATPCRPTSQTAAGAAPRLPPPGPFWCSRHKRACWPCCYTPEPTWPTPAPSWPSWPPRRVVTPARLLADAACTRKQAVLRRTAVGGS